jgi:hypothetical protein
MVAKGLGRAIGPLPGDRAPYSAAMPMLAGGGAVGQHPASMVPGVHVSEHPMGFASGGEVQPTDETGFDAYHGSPHEFPAEIGAPLGRFRSDKIGTGEGAQAFGHGLYFGEEPTARGYRNRLAPGTHLTLNGSPISTIADVPLKQVARWISNTRDHPDEIARISEQRAAEDAVDAKELGLDGRAFSEENRAIAKAARKLAQGGKWEIEAVSNGHLYHVRVNANPEHFLDWDKHRDKLAPSIQSFAQKNFPKSWENAADGASLYKFMAKELGSDAKTSAALQSAGIPGIRYLDAGSRGPNGNPTYNHVIFDPNIIDIKRRYERGGAVPNKRQHPTINHAISLTNAPQRAKILAKSVLPGRR